jgi:signal transduction histidine kinase
MNNFPGMDMKKRLAYLEQANRSKLQALALTRELGEFHSSINQLEDPGIILEKSRDQASKLIEFKSMAFFLIDESTSDFHLALCTPETDQNFIESEMEFFIEDGTFSRAVLEKNPITAHARDFENQFLFHVLATVSRVRGMFVGILEKKARHIPEASFELFSIMMSHCASGLESFDLYGQLKASNRDLQKKITQLSNSQARLKQEIHEKQALESKLWQARKMESIGLLAGGTAHDFNNLLTIIINYTDICFHGLPRDHGARASLEKIETASKRAMALARKLYTIGREDRHETHLVNLGLVIKETLGLLKSSLGKSITLEAGLPDMDLMVMAEETRIQQVLMNLITNAFHAMKTEAAGITGKILVTGERVILTKGRDQADLEIEPGPYIRMSVTDTGPGIDPAILPQVFDPYFSTKKTADNAGLGLAVVFGIVKNYQGGIDLKSVKGRGTSFHIYLPEASQ